MTWGVRETTWRKVGEIPPNTICPFTIEMWGRYRRLYIPAYLVMLRVFSCIGFAVYPDRTEMLECYEYRVVTRKGEVVYAETYERNGKNHYERKTRTREQPMSYDSAKSLARKAVVYGRVAVVLAILSALLSILNLVMRYHREIKAALQLGN